MARSGLDGHGGGTGGRPLWLALRRGQCRGPDVDNRTNGAQGWDAREIPSTVGGLEASAALGQVKAYQGAQMSEWTTSLARQVCIYQGEQESRCVFTQAGRWKGRPFTEGEK